MQNKLITLLNALNSEEWANLHKHILTRTSHKSDVYAVFKNLMSEKDRLTSWDTEYVRKREFNKLSKKVLLNHMSTINKWTDEYLCISNINSNHISKQLILLKEYSNRGLYKILRKIINDLDNHFSFNVGDTIEFHNQAKRFYTYLYYSDNPIKYQSGSELLKKLVHHHLHETLYHSYLLLTELHNWQTLRRIDHSEELRLINLVFDDSLLHENHILRKLKELVVHYNYDSFNELLPYTLESDHSVDNLMYRILHMYMISWSLKFWQNKELADVDIIVKLYESGLSRGILLSNGCIAQNRFHNILSTVGALTGRLWAEQFIAEWGPKVDAPSPKINIQLGKAQVALYYKDYENIIELTRELKFDGHGQQIRLLGIELIAWYEIGDFELFHNHVKNFKKYLGRYKNKVSLHYWESHYNLIRFLEICVKNNSQQERINYYKNSSRIMYRKYIEELLEK